MRIEIQTQAARMAVAMTVEISAWRHLRQMRDHAEFYALCDAFSHAEKYREWLHNAPRKEIAEFGAYLREHPLACARRARRGLP